MDYNIKNSRGKMNTVLFLKVKQFLQNRKVMGHIMITQLIKFPYLLKNRNKFYLNFKKDIKNYFIFPLNKSETSWLLDHIFI